MTRRWRALWNDECGGLLSAEYLLLGTLLAIGLIVGVAAVKESLILKFQQLVAMVCQ